MAKKKQKNRSKPGPKAVVPDAEVIAAAYSSVTCATPPLLPPVFIKVCRLCESKDGPFLNIFDADKITAKKIDEVMPFSVMENDDLPHKICFRCSAKLEELYEFIQKCIKTQENLHSTVGKSSSPFTIKSKMAKKMWEEKLNRTNMSNDDICDALIKKAMQGIKGIPTVLPTEEEAPPSEPKRLTRSKETAASKKEVKSDSKSDDGDDISLRQVKLSLEKEETKPVPTKQTRSNKADTALAKKTETASTKKIEQQKKTELQSPKPDDETKIPEASKSSSNSQSEKKANEQKRSGIFNFSFDCDDPASPVKEIDTEEEQKEAKKPFNIMDHISTIKVNGVGVLFQCKLCNRNFLKKEVVESHNCAKNGIPKTEIPKSVPPPEPPKVPSVKYIKIDNDMKKSLTEKIKLGEKSKNQSLSLINNTQTPDISYEPPKNKTKPKAGPASKTKKSIPDSDSSALQNSSESSNPVPVVPPTPGPPSVHFPLTPNLNGRFKLVPGPNNIFTLVEDTIAPPAPNSHTTNESLKKSSKKRKSDVANNDEVKTKDRKRDKSSPEVIDLEDTSKPYPVGLFQTVAHSAALYGPPATEAPPPPFTTPAMKKQSYTVVQTGNPSKLLISTKPKAAEVEVPKKRQKKAKLEVKGDTAAKEPFTVTLEDVAPPKDPGFFTFINVDPLLQPSYVLPTDNIIQESQISTSSAVRNTNESKEKGIYSCNMCGDTFSREKKLLAHIQSHYKKMDEEDNDRAVKSPRKKGKKLLK